MSEPLFRRVVLICDAVCDIHLAVADAASLAARLGATVHGIYLDDENLHRFAALPFGRQVSLSSPEGSKDLTAATMTSLSSALGAGMKRRLAELANARGLQWTFSAVRDVPSAVSVAAAEGDLLVVEAAARAFSGAWRPRAAWEKSPSAFTGTVLIRGRSDGRHGVLVLLPEDQEAREKVLSATAALAVGDERIILAGRHVVLADAQNFPAMQRTHIKLLALGDDPSVLRRMLTHRSFSLFVLHADDAEWAGDTGADILLVR